MEALSLGWDREKDRQGVGNGPPLLGSKRMSVGETLAIILTNSAVVSRAHHVFSPTLEIELE